MFRTEKTMFRPPGDVSQAARVLGKNNVWMKPHYQKCIKKNVKTITQETTLTLFFGGNFYSIFS